jgi:hypothetical protein
MEINDRKTAEQVSQAVRDTVIDGIITINQGPSRFSATVAPKSSASL